MKQWTIVFLPGMLGSRLRFGKLTWDPDNAREMTAWMSIPQLYPPEYLARVIDHTSPATPLTDAPGLTADEQERGWGEVVGGYYRKLLRFLAAGGSRVHALGFDWRQDVRSLVPNLEKRLMTIWTNPQAPGNRGKPAGRRMLLITHGMSGLLVRAALKATKGLQERVRGVIHVCEPAEGAVMMYRRVFTGTLPELDGGWPDLPLDWLLGDTPDRFLANISGLPGAVQLLPSPAYRPPCETRWPPANGPALVHDVYEHDVRPPGLMPANASALMRKRLPKRLLELREFHGQLQGYHHPQTWSISGTGRQTDVSVAFDGRGNPILDRQPHGDGTVPEPGPSRKALDAARRTVIPDLDHADACNDPRVWFHVARILREVAAQVTPARGPVSARSPRLGPV
jgi:hypothetical protein